MRSSFNVKHLEMATRCQASILVIVSLFSFLLIQPFGVTFLILMLHSHPFFDLALPSVEISLPGIASPRVGASIVRSNRNEYLDAIAVLSQLGYGIIYKSLDFRGGHTFNPELFRGGSRLP